MKCPSASRCHAHVEILKKLIFGGLGYSKIAKRFPNINRMFVFKIHLKLNNMYIGKKNRAIEIWCFK